MADAIWRFCVECGRMGDVSSVFIADEAVVKAAIGKHVYFGEILGKHSNICGVLEGKDLVMASNDPAAVKLVSSLGILPTGHNPLEYLDE